MEGFGGRRRGMVLPQTHKRRESSRLTRRLHVRTVYPATDNRERVQDFFSWRLSHALVVRKSVPESRGGHLALLPALSERRFALVDGGVAAADDVGNLFVAGVGSGLGDELGDGVVALQFGAEEQAEGEDKDVAHALQPSW